MDIKKAFGRGDIPESMSADQAYAVAQKVSESTFPCDAYDPTTDLRALNIPGLWLMGDRDWMVPSEPEIHNLQRLRELGKPYEYRNIPGAGHSMQGGPKNLVEDTIKQWLARVTNQ
jgi:pimeloyl-ACP methyl ester carboxylesterase